MPIIEIAISVLNGGPGQAQRGDIVEAREPYYTIGTSEMRRYLWLRVAVGERLAIDLKEISEHKRHRYHVSMERLAAVCPSLDMGRVTDPNAEYQPLLRRGIISPLRGEDLIVDAYKKELIHG